MRGEQPQCAHQRHLGGQVSRVEGVRELLTGLCALALFATFHAAASAPRQTQPGEAPVFEQPPPGTPNLTGKWLMSPRITHMLTSSGHEPPLSAAGKAEYTRRKKALDAGDRSIDPITRCLMHGTPRLLYAPYPFLILQTTRSINFVHEVNHTFRNIYWGTDLPTDPDPTYLGSSLARWEGRTLVIDSVGFNDSTWLDYSGLPHSDKLQVQERYTLKGPDTISGSVRITDPDDYTASWTSRFTLKRQPGMALKENVCTDTHRM